MGTRNLRPKKGDLVIVRWADFAGHDSGEPDPPVFETSGWYVGPAKLNGVDGYHLARDRIIAGKDYKVGWDWYPKGPQVKLRVVERP